MPVMKLVRENPRADNIMMFDFAHCVDRCLDYPWRVPVTGKDKLITWLSKYTHCTVRSQLEAVYLVMDILTSNCLRFLILTGSGPTDDCLMCILGHMLGGCIGSAAVASLVSAFLLCANKWCILCSAWQSTRVRSALTWLRGLCIDALLVWNRWGRW